MVLLAERALIHGMNGYFLSSGPSKAVIRSHAVNGYHRGLTCGVCQLIADHPSNDLPKRNACLIRAAMKPAYGAAIVAPIVQMTSDRSQSTAFQNWRFVFVRFDIIQFVLTFNHFFLGHCSCGTRTFELITHPHLVHRGPFLNSQDLHIDLRRFAISSFTPSKANAVPCIILAAFPVQHITIRILICQDKDTPDR